MRYSIVCVDWSDPVARRELAQSRCFMSLDWVNGVACINAAKISANCQRAAYAVVGPDPERVREETACMLDECRAVWSEREQWLHVGLPPVERRNAA